MVDQRGLKFTNKINTKLRLLSTIYLQKNSSTKDKNTRIDTKINDQKYVTFLKMLPTYFDLIYFTLHGSDIFLKVKHENSVTSKRDIKITTINRY